MAIENSHVFFTLLKYMVTTKFNRPIDLQIQIAWMIALENIFVIHWWYWIRDWLSWHTCARIFSEIEKASYLSGLYYTVLKKTHDHSVPCCDFDIQFHAQLWFELPDFFYAVSLDPLNSISMYWKYNLKNYGSMLKHVIMDYFLK